MPNTAPISTQANMPAKESSLFSTLKPIIVLVSICVVAGVLLGLVYTRTAPIAQAAAEAREQATYQELVSEAASFDPLKTNAEGCTALLEAKNASGGTIGYIVKAQGKGYSGPVPLAVAFDTGGTITGITAMKNDETPGLGTRIAEQDFIGQFVGLAADQVQPETTLPIDTISGATISSNAAIDAFSYAARAYQGVK